MKIRAARRLRKASLLIMFSVTVIGSEAHAEEPYKPIVVTMADKSIVLTGQDLTIEQVAAIARHGAKVEIADALRQGAADSHGLILQAQAEGVPVYLFNRGAGSTRETVTLKGAPDSEEYKSMLARRYGNADSVVPLNGFGEDIKDEAVGRAMLVVDLNNMRYLPASAPFVQGIADLLNRGVTPAVYWRGAIGEADFVPTGNVLRGRGLAYYKGVKMPAAKALATAGLKPIAFDAADGSLGTTSALTAGFAALLLGDARQMLEWHDLVWAMELNGMNGSIGPITMPVQAYRPFPWANYAARKTLDMLKGSYVFNGEPRIIQDPESLRATVWRVGSLWEAWARLRGNVQIQMNSTDHNPTIRPGISPEDAWELSTPQLMKYYVKGGKWSNGKNGYILSNSNWDPYPLVNDVEAFSIPLVNLMVAVVERMHRFEDPFFTVTNAGEFLKVQAGPGGVSGAGGGGGGGALADALWQELKPLANPIAPDGVTADKGVGDLDAVPMLKLMRFQQAINVSYDMLGQNLQNAAFWMDIRKMENADRTFGAAPTAAWQAFRRVVPFRADPNAPAPTESVANSIASFIRSTPPRRFYPSTTIPIPGGENVKPPRAEIQRGLK